MAQRVVLIVELVDYDAGHWCQDCMLSTGVRLYVAIRTGVTMDLQETLVCVSCRGRNIELATEEA